MAKKKMGRPRVEYVIRVIEVKSVQMYVTDHIDDRRSLYNPGGDAWLAVRGTMDEPIDGQSEVEISIHEVEKDERTPHGRPKSIGALIQLKPRVQVVLDMPSALFDRAWAMASGGKLMHVWISMTKPHRGHAPVISVQMQNEPIE